jgi:hypothetical protein
MVTGLNWPVLCAAVLLDGVGAARVRTPSEAPIEQRVKARRTRGLKMPDLEDEFFFMMILSVVQNGNGRI